MQEEIDLVIAMTRDSMQAALDHLSQEFTKIRTGKANPTIFDSVYVDYYGAPTPLSGAATIKILDARSITITPWEKGMLGAIEKGIFEANLGLTPMNDGILIRISIPPLTEERRRELMKNVGGYVEHAKVGIRNARRDAMEEVKKAVKNGFPEDAGKRSEEVIQALTNEYSAKADKYAEAKEKDIMTI